MTSLIVAYLLRLTLQLIAEKWLFKAFKYRSNPEGDSHKHREIWSPHGGDVSDIV